MGEVITKLDIVENAISDLMTYCECFDDFYCQSFICYTCGSLDKILKYELLKCEGICPACEGLGSKRVAQDISISCNICGETGKFIVCE